MRKLINSLFGGPNHCHFDPNLLCQTHQWRCFVPFLYVDDLVPTWTSSDMTIDMKKKLMSTYEMTDIGFLHYFLGI